jgi:hypothetical protein
LGGAGDESVQPHILLSARGRGPKAWQLLSEKSHTGMVSVATSVSCLIAKPSLQDSAYAHSSATMAGNLGFVGWPLG